MSQKLSEELRLEGVKNEKVLLAIANTNRGLFMPPDKQALADLNHAIPIGHGQTISQPFVVARMTELLLGETDHLKNVLEIGTGSGYQAAVLSGLADQITTIEHIKPLYESAKEKLKNHKNISVHFADGYLGWPSNAPYDGIIVTAGANAIPQALLDQLALNGRLVIPLGKDKVYQELTLVNRLEDGFHYLIFDPVVFVPLLPGISE